MDWNYLPKIIDSTHAYAQLIANNGTHGTGLAMTSDGGTNWIPVAVPNPD